MNDTELLALCARLEGLLAKATPGKWDWDADAIKGDPLGRHRARICTIGKTITQAYYTDESGVNDAALIAAMKNALPALLRAVREGVEARQAIASGAEYVRGLELLEAEQICIRYAIECEEEAAQHRSRDHHKVAGELHQEALGAKECAKRIRVLKEQNSSRADDQNAVASVFGPDGRGIATGANDPSHAAPVAERSASVMVLREIVEFLFGRAPLDGVWFGDKHPHYPGVYWWRIPLRNTSSAAPAPVVDEEAVVVAISEYLHSLDVLQPLAWHMARGISVNLAQLAIGRKP